MRARLGQPASTLHGSEPSSRAPSFGASYSFTVAAYQEFEQERIKHMEIIQAVVSRLANEAALIRGWALTVSAVFFGFAARTLSWRIAAVGMLPVLAFWGLNAYYLRSERQYRSLFDRVRKMDPQVEPFSMGARGEQVPSWWNTAWSRTLGLFYGPIAIVGVVMVIAGASGG
jgi:hypothetical protein